MKHYSYATAGVCSRMIEFDIADDGTVHNVRFLGGCPGNTSGLAMLAEGMSADELMRRLKGIRCRDKATSCPDQFASALAEAMR